jgi:hypothetical protein
MIRQKQYLACSLLLGILLLCGCKAPKKKWPVKLRRDGKEAYDTYLAYRSLPYYFAEATVSNLPPDFDFTTLNSSQDYNQQGHSLLILTGKSLQFNEAELQELVSFTGQGNEVLILCSNLDQKIGKKLGFVHHGGREYQALSRLNKGSDNIGVLRLNTLPGKKMGMNGRYLRSYFELKAADSSYDEDLYASSISKPLVLGYADSLPNLIRYELGNGHITLHATPLVLTNYFLLQEGNRVYLDELFKGIPGEINTIYWAGFGSRAPDMSSWSILMRHPATRWFLLIMCSTLAIYLLFQLKRRQRIIPVIPAAKNSSVAFAETVGMLYFNKGDNVNLAQKMIQHFLEWVRSNYFLNTNNLNDIFAEQLAIRSGLPPALAGTLLTLIHEVRLEQRVSDDQLFHLYQIIQQFYKTRVQ